MAFLNADRTSFGAVLNDVEDGGVSLQGRLGYQASEYLGLEGEAAFGLFSDEDTVNGVEVSENVDYQFAGFATARLPLTDSLAFRGRGGYHFSNLSGSVEIAGGEVDFDRSEDGFAYGIGLELALSPRDSLRLDSTVYEVPGENLDAISLAWQRRF